MRTLDTRTLRQLRVACYEEQTLHWDRTSAHYERDCDALWAHLLTRTVEQLRETLGRWTAINDVTDREIALHCQLY